MQTCNSSKTGTSTLPDMYTGYLRVSADLSDNARVLVLQLACNNSGSLKICPNIKFILISLSIYTTMGSQYEYTISILMLS